MPRRKRHETNAAYICVHCGSEFPDTKTLKLHLKNKNKIINNNMTSWDRYQREGWVKMKNGKEDFLLAQSEITSFTTRSLKKNRKEKLWQTFVFSSSRELVFEESSMIRKSIRSKCRTCSQTSKKASDDCFCFSKQVKCNLITYILIYQPGSTSERNCN